MFDKTVKTVTIFVSISFLLSGHFAPCNGDVLSFQALLANYTSQKHLGTSPNLTSDDQMQRSPAILPSSSESEAFSPYFRNTKFLCFMPKACSSMPDYWHWCLNFTPAEQSLLFSLVYFLQIIVDLPNWACRSMPEHASLGRYWCIYYYTC